MRKVFILITALIVAVAVGAVVFRRLTEDPYGGSADSADVQSDQGTAVTVDASLSDLGE
jgi:hypothetical protein